ncbi:polysaccharide lyase family 7 protein [Pseudomonas guariconensis]|uniref:polysaccharide lyase family 7 protein n=1 Tax=Pseudomonas guariconensis TaxID=1288410 RepID=UPI0018AC57D0|nr:polysaccharide lyase family 7 protein [Pseudomonas guariconensis]MBF8740761.1 polysaccharide lyase family 7 protein [Pseudomonas guariconensis]MBF8750148.1 polysaccharide lyase family 7 protein [Pseudomonas guariconensis]
MAVNIDNLIITTPVAKSATDPTALEVTGAVALATLPDYVSRLPDGSVRMSAPTKGASSKSTHRTRCEWKEAVYWALDSAANHRNYQLFKLEKVNSIQKVVIAQLHVKDDDSPPIKVFWSKGKLTYGFRAEFNQATAPTSTLLAEVPLNAVFEISIEVATSGAVVLSASCNGRTGRITLQLAESWRPRIFNFHGGVYNQVDYSDTTSPEDGSVCAISQLDLVHL